MSRGSPLKSMNPPGWLEDRPVPAPGSAEAALLKRRDKKERTRATLVTGLQLRLAEDKSLTEFYSTF